MITMELYNETSGKYETKPATLETMSEALGIPESSCKFLATIAINSQNNMTEYHFCNTPGARPVRIHAN
jgi:hypothetical protein